MKLFILNQVREFANTREGLEEMLDNIDTTTQDGQYFLSHLLIDGVEVYEDFEDYLENNLSSVKEIRVKINTRQEFVGAVLQSSRGYLENALHQLPGLGEAFYQSSDEKAWNDLADFFEGLLWLLQSSTVINSDPKLKEEIPDLSSWTLYVQKVEQIGVAVIPELQSAVEQQDRVLIADLIQYEITPAFQEMMQSLEGIAPEEVETRALH